MTGGVDAAFVARVRDALADEVRTIVAEAGTDAWRHLEHRRLAERVKALVAAWCGAAGETHAGDDRLLEHAGRLAGMLRELQGPSGLFRGGDNVDSPPDSAFSVNDLADAALLLGRHRAAAPPPAGHDRPALQDHAEPARPDHGGPAEPGHAEPARPDHGGPAEPGHAEPAPPDHGGPAEPGHAEPAPPGHGGPAGRAAADETAARLGEILEAVTPALVTGGVHTPNHRWEISAALARLHRLAPRAALAERVDQWLAERVDIEDGLYSERSANYAAYVSNPSLLAIAAVFDRPELVDAVEQNLDATLALLLPDGSVETVLSRRQDQRSPVFLAPYLLPLRRVAQLRGRGDLAWAAGRALDQGIVAPADAAAGLLIDPVIGRRLPAPVEPARTRQRHFAGAGLLVDHRAAATTVVFGGSDYGRHGRIRSGLANSPTFLRLFAGAAVLDSVRLSRTFFGLGPFRAQRLTVAAADGGGTRVTLAETVAAAYYQPLGAGDLDPGGRYQLGDDGRFSAAMDFGRRDRDRVSLATTVAVEVGEGRVGLVLEVAGAEVDWALELAFRPGGTMRGARPLDRDGASRWRLDPPVGEAHYEVGKDSLSVTVTEASDGRGGAFAECAEPPGYYPGEEYEFLGGTDAATGERLYLGGRAPARVRIDISAYTRR